MKKGNCKSYEIYCCGECIDTLCDYDGMWLRTEKDRSCFGTGTEDQYHTGTITNTGTGYGRCGSSYFEWRYQYGESVSGRKSISGDKQYRYGCGDANTTDASNMQSQDQSEDTSGSSDEGGDNEE